MTDISKTEMRQKIETNKIKTLVDMKIANETLDVSGHTTEYASAKKQLEKDYNSILTMTNRWGCLMQAEMKTQNKERLTSDIYQKSRENAWAGFPVDPIAYTVATQLLSVTWKHGEDFAKFEGMDLSSVKEARSVFADKEGYTRPTKLNPVFATKGMGR